MSLSARSLELYNMPGAGAAAREISKAVTSAKAEMCRHLHGVKKGSFLDGNGKIKPEIIVAYRIGRGLVTPVLSKQSKVGACDSEPVHVVKAALIEAIAKHLKLDEWGRESLMATL